MTIELVACIGMITGFFIIMNMSVTEFTDGIFKSLTESPKSLKDIIGEETKRKKPSLLRREINEIQEILKLTGRTNKFSIICTASIGMFAIGASLAIVVGNLFLVPVLAVGFMMIPIWYVKMSSHHYKNDISAEIETAMSIITSAYLRNEDIITSTEENLHYLNPPIFNVFEDFLAQVKLNPDMDKALKNLKYKIDNGVFAEWCEALSTCQYDRSVKSILSPIVSKLSDMRTVNRDLEYLIFEPRKEFITMAILVIANIPLMYFLNKDWYETLMHTAIGQVILAFTITVIFVSTAFVIRLTKPIEYKR